MLNNNSLKKILVVDDEEIMRSFLSDVLSDNGYDVQATSSGKEALKLVRRSKPDLLILDVVLPDIDGNNVASALKENPSTANIPIIFLTGILTKEEKEAMGTRDSKQYVIAKPTTAKELLDTINNIFHG